MKEIEQAEAKGFEFPCEYPIKAMGSNTPEFVATITEIVKQHAPEVSSNSVHCRTSSTGKYQSVTVLIYAHSKEHLINIYQDIRAVDDVMWTL